MKLSYKIKYSSLNTNNYNINNNSHLLVGGNNSNTWPPQLYSIIKIKKKMKN